MKTISNRIIKQGTVNWKSLKFIQADNFKELSPDDKTKLKQSIIKNDMVESLKVWDSGKEIYCCDGYHRVAMFKELESEGYTVPEKVTADYIQCRSKKDAAKLVLIYSSKYADITQDGLAGFLESYNLNFDEIKLEIDIPNFNMDKFNMNFINTDLLPIQEKEINENSLKIENECPKCKYIW